MFSYTIATVFTGLFQVDNDDKYMQGNIPELLSLFLSDVFQHYDVIFWIIVHVIWLHLLLEILGKMCVAIVR